MWKLNGVQQYMEERKAVNMAQACELSIALIVAARGLPGSILWFRFKIAGCYRGLDGRARKSIEEMRRIKEKAAENLTARHPLG